MLKIPRGLNVGNARFRFIAASVLVALPLFYAAGQTDNAKSGSSKSAADSLPDGPGKELVLKKCVSCHSIQTGDEWAQIVSTMVGRGAVVSDDDADAIVDYLAAHFGPSSAKPGSSSSAGASPTPGSGNSDTSTPIYINKATVDQLRSGLGLTQAQAGIIVHYREKNGDFKDFPQLLAVPGIDSALLKNEQSKIAF
jgi:competence ComEA-like helix-hairpin-helix protein